MKIIISEYQATLSDDHLEYFRLVVSDYSSNYDELTNNIQFHINKIICNLFYFYL